ncbi:MAG TPA: hypothetical protein VEC96_00145 [Anaerolineae bacterium]|nr:hypothetical protein [Anaerolineae bacterium]
MSNFTKMVGIVTFNPANAPEITGDNRAALDEAVPYPRTATLNRSWKSGSLSF